jgi:hypothetical protein
MEAIRNGQVLKGHPDKSPKTFKELLGYIVCNGGRDCFTKSHGKVWMITRTGNWEYVCRNITDLTFDEYLKLSLK